MNQTGFSYPADLVMYRLWSFYFTVTVTWVFTDQENMFQRLAEKLEFFLTDAIKYGRMEPQSYSGFSLQTMLSLSILGCLRASIQRAPSREACCGNTRKYTLSRHLFGATAIETPARSDLVVFSLETWRRLRKNEHMISRSCSREKRIEEWRRTSLLQYLAVIYRRLSEHQPCWPWFTAN